MSNDLEFLQQILKTIEFKYQRAIKHRTDLEISYDDYDKLYSVSICTHYINDFNDEVDPVRLLFTSDNADLKTALKECAKFLLKKEKKSEKDAIDHLEESLFYFDPKPEPNPPGYVYDGEKKYSPDDDEDEKKYSKDLYGCKYRHMSLVKFEECENRDKIFFCSDCNGYFKLRKTMIMGVPSYEWDRESEAVFYKRLADLSKKANS